MCVLIWFCEGIMETCLLTFLGVFRAGERRGNMYEKWQKIMKKRLGFHVIKEYIYLG